MLQGCKTTRIYCRLDCPPGRLMKPVNRVFFASYAEASSSGYRPCKVCRPEAPPDGREWRRRASFRVPATPGLGKSEDGT